VSLAKRAPDRRHGVAHRLRGTVSSLTPCDLVVLLLAAALAACAVKLPSPPPATDQTCILECQAQHIRCLHILGTSRSNQKKCANYLGACYDSGCRPPEPTPQQSAPQPLFRQ
jgi:hypothetical protein